MKANIKIIKIIKKYKENEDIKHDYNRGTFHGIETWETGGDYYWLMEVSLSQLPNEKERNEKKRN
jgi:hypothetical protein